MKKSSTYVRHGEQPPKFTKPVSEVGARSRGVVSMVTDPVRNDCSDLVLDLSGKSGNNSVAMVTRQKWTREQEAALDLSHHGLAGAGQYMALDLSVPSQSQSHLPLHQPSVSSSQPQPRVSSSQPQPPMQKSPSHHRPPGQYSLLQAALRSTQSSAVFQPVIGMPSESDSRRQPGVGMSSQSKPSSSAPIQSQDRTYSGGMVMMDEGRTPVQPFQESSTIRPFTSGALRPLGISVPHVAFPSSSGTVIPRSHKPVAITTPQVQTSHVSITETLNQSTVSVGIDSHSNLNTSAESLPIGRPSSQSQSGSAHGANLNQLGGSSVGGSTGIQAGMVSSGEKLVERYLIRTPEGLNHLLGSRDFIQMEQQLGYACTMCPKIFKSKAALKLHMTVHKTNEERQFECNICHRRFLHRHHLVVHHRKHSGEKPFTCDACGKSFMAIFLLHKHLRKHVRENSLAAEISSQQLKELNVKKTQSECRTRRGVEHDPVIVSCQTHPGASECQTRRGVEHDPVIVSCQTRPGVEHDPVIVSDDEESGGTVKAGTCDEKVMHERSAVKPTVNPETNVLNEQVSVPHRPELSKSSIQVTDVLPEHIQRCLQSSRSLSSDGSSDGNTVDVRTLVRQIIDASAISNSCVKPTITKESNTSFQQQRQTVERVEEVKKDKVKNVVEVDPWPEYSSSDEVELDFSTGELKVIRTNKVEDNISETKNEHLCKNSKIEITKTNPEQMDSNKVEIETRNVLSEIVSTVCSNSMDENIKDLGDSLPTTKESDVATEHGNNGTDLAEFDKVIYDGIVRLETEMAAAVNTDNEKLLSDNKNICETNEAAIGKEYENIKKESDTVMTVDGAYSSVKCDKHDNSIDREDHVSYSQTHVEANADNNNITKEENVNKHSSDSGTSGSETETSDEIENQNTEMVEAITNTPMQPLSPRKRTSSAEETVNLNSPNKTAKLEELTSEQTKDAVMCSECGKSLPTEEEFRLHMVSHKAHAKGRKWGKKKGKKLKCEICSKTVHTKHHLLLHMNVHKKNHALDSLKKAKANQIKANGFKTGVHCNVCKKVFKFQKSLNSHMRIHSEKLAERKMLSQAFRAIMEEATTSDHGVSNVRQMRSSVSDAESQLKNSLGGKSHSKSLDEDSITETDIVAECRTEHSQSVEGTSSTAASSKNETPDEPPVQVVIGEDNVKRYLCHACDNTYSTKQKLRMHAMIHKDNCYLCDVCGRSFFREVTLEKHIGTHMLPRPHICSVCKKSFIHKSSLMRHRAAHEKSPVSSVKQFADVNFEMKMMNTYSMLQRENLAPLQMKKLGIPEQETQNVMDLSMRKIDSSLHCPESACDVNVATVSYRVDPRSRPLMTVTPDVSLPPVLSPAHTPDSTPVSVKSAVDLSPPIITMDSCHVTKTDQSSVKIEPVANVKSELGSREISMNIKTIPFISEGGEDDKHIGRRKKCTIFSKRNTSLHTFHGKHRKTRVYRTSCRICKEGFPNVMSLKTHMTIHNTVETHLYECQVCSHRFTQSCSLLRHCKTSCQDRNLKCMPCKKTFQRRNAYEKHMVSHIHSLPSLDGSFLEYRKDDVQVCDIKEEQQCATDITYQHPILKGVKAEIKEEICDDNFGNECDGSDSDARTMLYSEGEGYTNSLSDFSDNSDIENTPPSSPKKEIDSNVLNRSPDSNALLSRSHESNVLSRSHDSNVLSRSHDSSELDGSHESSGLSFLSAICSDIILAEKNEELKRKHIETQQELETVEILTNLGKVSVNNKDNSAINRTRVSNLESDSDVKPCIKSEYNCPTPETKPMIEPYDFSKPFDLSKSHTSKAEGQQQQQLPQHRGHKVKVEDSSDCQITGIERPEMNNIPTVVYEIHAEAERRRRERLMQMLQGSRIVDLQSRPDTVAAADGTGHPLFQDMTRLHPSQLAALMKAQLPIGSLLSPVRHSTPLSNSSPTSNVHTVPTSRSPTSAKVYPLTHTVTSETSNCSTTPTDLSKKQKPVQQKALDLSPRASPRPISRSPPSDLPPPALVPVFHCELCGKLLYCKTDLHTHLREHGVSPKSTPPQSPQQSPRATIPYHRGSQTAVQSRSCTSSTVTGSRSEVAVSPSITIPAAHSGYRDNRLMSPGGYTPLAPLNLSGALSRQWPSNQSTIVSSSQPAIIDVGSPVLGSDLGDTFQSPSPSGSAMNIDELRKELRNKIYARRKSQGLEELTVEFKQPEPAEMSLEERQKLNYRRECNRQAAQRSRMRKKDLVDSLLEQLHKEEMVSSGLRRQMEFLSTEKKSLTQLFDNHKCLMKKHS